MTKKIKILVSGCGGDIGQSIGKILLTQTERFDLYGIDINAKNPGKFIFKNFSIGLPVNHIGYMDFILEYLDKNKIDLFLPIAEPELRFFATKGITGKIGNAKMITANLKAMQIGFDKYVTSEFLKKSNLPFPLTFIANSIPLLLSFPFILKSRIGSGSKKLFIVENEIDLQYFRNKLNLRDYVGQEFLPDNEGEYTCGLFRSNTGETRFITFKRELTGGYSGYGEIINNERIDILLMKIAKELDLKGSINVQIRFKEDQPIVFEINPRFSSTVLFRNLFGFDDVIWSIQDALGLPISDYEQIKHHKFFYKGFSEYVD